MPSSNSGGLAVRVGGLALFQAKGKPDEDGDEGEPDGRLVIVDANGASVTPTIGLKSGGGEYGDGEGDPAELPIVQALRESGGGKRFAMIGGRRGNAAREPREAQRRRSHRHPRGTEETRGVDQVLSGRAVGDHHAAGNGAGAVLHRRPGETHAIDGRSLGFSADSKLLLVDKATENGPGRVWGVPVDGGSEVVFAEGDIRFRGSVGNSVAIAEPTALYLSNKAGDRRPLDMPYNREEDEDTFISPIGTGNRGLIFSGDGENEHWALVDENEAKVTPLPALDKFSLIQVSDERILFAGGYNEDAQVPTSFTTLDIASGKVTSAVTWDPAGAQVPFPLPSPDGRSVAITYSREGEQGSRAVILTPGEGVKELDGGVAAWAPDGTAVLLGRRVGDGVHMIAVDLATKKEKDLGPGFGGVWTTS